MTNGSGRFAWSHSGTFFDVTPGEIVKITAQIVTSRDSQIATSIDKKPRLGDIMFLGEAIAKCRHGVGPAAAEHVRFNRSFDSVSIAA
jgi:hypothetical protein